MPVCHICRDQVQDFVWVSGIQGSLVAVGFLTYERDDSRVVDHLRREDYVIRRLHDADVVVVVLRA